jgi:excisionase family DNA binding protein
MAAVPPPTAKRTRKSQFPKRGSPVLAVADAVLTIDDLVVYLKLPKSTVYKLAQEGKIPGQKVGRHWRFHRAVIDRWLAGNNGTGA